MRRLIDKGLMFGNLIRVESPALVERYNRALSQLTGRRTALEAFHIDISGFSPEVADELGDPLYLNPNGCNRQFILLAPEQKTAPLLDAKFSMSRDVLRQFITRNEAQIFSLTARDAMCGEIENSVFDLHDPNRLLNIRWLSVVADTTGNHVAEAARLTQLIARFQTEASAWHDDDLMRDIIEASRKTGDVTRNPLTLQATEVESVDYWTSHFGGVYLFRSTAQAVAICMGERLAQLRVDKVLTGVQRNEIAQFLEQNGLVEPLVNGRGDQAGAIIRQKMDFILVDAAADLGVAQVGSRRELRKVAQSLGANLPPAFDGLAALLRWAEADGPWPAIDSRHPAYFYTLRARQGPLRDQVNMLLAELAPLDVRALYICHKELFYKLYAAWPDIKRAYVADFLEKEYLIDKVGARKRLFGAEPQMPVRDTVELVGPWGPISGGE
ncbi:DUF6638 family protein [Albirhodobacter sp. R86504]|jgi:hypothetical protein|uniref:DUF6638 family protein n=1 Tax=Albirhodobacter sp. R86504 TaxID=3093848 RepID=UPI0036708159